jgi:prepilin signal peptidase PulO-like enzyme (type II secretory pathway)
MLTFLLLVLSTALGAVVGHYVWAEPVIGAVVGFLLGLMVRWGESFVDAGDLVD